MRLISERLAPRTSQLTWQMRKPMWWFEVVHGAVFNIPVDVSAEVDKAEESQVDVADGSAVDVEVVELIWGRHGWSTWQLTWLVNARVSAVNMANTAGQCGGQHD